MRQRAAIVLIEEGRVALIKRVRDGKTYYVFPGGGIEAGETPKEAAEREALEELGVKVDLGTCIFQVKNPVCEYYFSATIISGQFGSATGDEFTDAERGRGSYEAVWMPLEMLSSVILYPEQLAIKISQIRIK